MKGKFIFIFVVLVVVIGAAVAAFFFTRKSEEVEKVVSPLPAPPVTNDFVQVDSPRPGDAITSPLRIIGKARGNWYFEATFPVVLVDWDGRIIAEHYAQAKGDWMTADWVPFEAEIEFSKPEYGERGTLILRKDNPSGLPEHDASVEVPILFKEAVSKEKDIEIIAEHLQIPWEISFLPEGDFLVTERPGTLRQIGKDGRVYAVEGVEHVGEGGLLGLALHPRFSENRFLYLYLTTQVGSGLKNRVERYRFDANRLSERTTIIDTIPGAAYHDGGRIAFGPDGYLYLTTGDAGEAKLAQDINSLAGKILRLRDDGSIPEDNPFGNAVYSYGHRNSQGLAWDDKGRLWATEHGRSGILSGLDELNLIEKGRNYGWPLIQGDEKKEGMESPVLQSGSRETWAPAGGTYWNGSLFFAGLRGETLYEAKILEGSKVSLIPHFQQKFGRLRAVVLGPDGRLYISTSNADGRGEMRAGDDKIIRINPRIFR